MSHPRVVNVRGRALGDRAIVYVGRGRCPCKLRPCPHILWSDLGGPLRKIDFGNPFNFQEHGPRAMLLFLDYLAANETLQAIVSERLRNSVLACWCAPRPCHAEVYARLADGEPLSKIREDMLKAVGLSEEP